MKLNLGCGRDIKQGYINCDHVSGPGVDFTFDMSKFPWPIPPDIAEEIIMSHVLEHIWNWPQCILEAYRVLKFGGILEVRVPYGIGWYNTDPHHVRYFWPGTLDMFMNDTQSAALDVYSEKKMFLMISRRIRRVFWFGWHLKKYLGICGLAGKRYNFPIGQKVEIIWRMKKM